jgi:hypothetical protein
LLALMTLIRNLGRHILKQGWIARWYIAPVFFNPNYIVV